MPRLLTLAALLALAPTAAAQDTLVRPVVLSPAPASSAVFEGMYATDGGMVELRSTGADLTLVAHGAPVAAALAALAPADEATDARAAALLDAWVTGDLAPFADAARPSQRAAMTRTLTAYRAALTRGRGAALAGDVVGTFAQTDGRRATLVQMVFERGPEWAAFVWDEAGALVTVHRGLPPVEVAVARASGPDAFVASGTPVTFDREGDGRVHAVRIGTRVEAVR